MREKEAHRKLRMGSKPQGSALRHQGFAGFPELVTKGWIYKRYFKLLPLL